MTLTLDPQAERESAQSAPNVQSSPERDTLSPAARLALLRSLRGRAKGRGPTVDEFLAERSAEAKAPAGANL